LFDCIERGVKAGLIGTPRGRTAQDLVRRLEDEYAHLGAGAQAQAARDAKRVIREETLAKRQHVLDTIRTQRRLAEQLDGYRDIFGGAERAGALPALLENDQAARFPNVRSIREALRGRYHRMIAGFLGEHQRDALGRVRKRAEVSLVVRELFGEGTGNASARELAEAVGEAFEAARTDFNAAGGRIGQLQDFGLPHAHDGARIRRAGFEAWFAEIAPRLDWARIKDFETGNPFTGSNQARRREFLQGIYDDVTTDGWAKREPSMRAAGRPVYARRRDHRVLHFRGADDWLAYNEAFGRADPFSTIVSHLDVMARDIALMRVLGPNPAAGLEFAVQHLERAAATQPWKVVGAGGRVGVTAADQVRSKAALARTMLGIVSGAGNLGGNRFWAETFAATRYFLTAGQLGSAMLSALGDTFLGAMAARHVGMPALAPLARQFRLMVDSGARAEALRMGVVADMAANVGLAASRYMDEVTAPAVAERLADVTLRLSYLTQWTEMGRHAFQLEMFGFLAEHAGRAWDELPDPLRRLFLERRGFTPADWDAIRAAPLHVDASGATFLIPEHVIRQPSLLADAERADGLSLRLMAAIQEETDFAVPTSSLRGRAILLGAAPPGTFAGELLRSAAGYRGFAMSIVMNNLRRVMLADLRDPRVAAIGAFLALTTFAGAIAIQAKEVAKGRDPRAMDDPKFWAAAFLQGGGVGIFGDFFAAAENRFGNPFAETLAGPTVSFAADTAALTFGNLLQVVRGDDTDAGRELVGWLRQYTPGASLWYLSLAAQRLGFDTLQRALDPEADAAFRRADARRVRNNGNAAWWAPGQTAPARAPDLSAAMGGP
jgi:hypothetical protein